MNIKKIIKIFFIILFSLALILFIYSKSIKTSKDNELLPEISQEEVYNSNIIKDINYTTKDTEGNEYIITALQGEIDYSNTNILFLTEVKANINLVNSEKINITSDYGKYNSNNYDTILQKM